MKALDQHISIALNHYATQLETHFQCDVIAYMGPIYPMALPQYAETIEALKLAAVKPANHHTDRLVIVLTTPGGVVESVEKMVEITRHHYADVSFVVPDSAMSAGTVWCMSGDRIWMDYASSLGPVDPQVQAQNMNGLVPALGYIDKVNEFISKSNAGTLSPAEVIMLKGLDLAELHRFEQARDLSISLLKQWLVAYKFKNWTLHRTINPGSLVTEAEKEARAEQIARDLSDNKRWHSHGRMIGMGTLKSILRLEIDDYSNIPVLRDNVRIYNALLSEYVERQPSPMIIHSART
ncbi:SDH family Clp fold serine proteinase [Collimonas fungivorans]|uniref:SDH family Clp fold serine proteinase n=1 Tax=Collimonas fungivorans TaxID=158899 RepID=UPI003FA3A6CD